MQQSLSELEFCGDLVCTFKTNLSRANFSDRLEKVSYVTNAVDILRTALGFEPYTQKGDGLNIHRYGSTNASYRLLYVRMKGDK